MPVLEETLRSGLSMMKLSADENTLSRFRTYYEYLEEMNRVMNLTAITGEKNVAELHFLDCAALLNAADFCSKRVIDVGTGAGFPGIPLKILCPSVDLTLLDSLDKRIHFLADTCEKIGYPEVRCIHARAEEAPAEFRESFDYASSRAVARLNLLAELCLPLVKVGGAFIALKSIDTDAELQEAKRGIAMLGGKIERIQDYTIPGTDVTHRLVVIRKIASTPARYPRRWGQMKKQPL